MKLVNGKAFSKMTGVVATIALALSVQTYLSPAEEVSADKVDKKVVYRLLAPVPSAEDIAKQKVKMEKATLNAYANQKSPFTDAELVHMLQVVGFSGRALREAWAIVKKESKGRPLAHNRNGYTGDNSYGLFQINMIGYLGSIRREKYGLSSDKALLNPVTNARVAYKMSAGGEDWTSWKVGAGYNGSDQRKFKEWYAKFPKGEANARVRCYIKS